MPVSRYIWQYVWVKQGRPYSEQQWHSYTDARHIAEMEIRRANRAMLEQGYKPLMQARERMSRR